MMVELISAGLICPLNRSISHHRHRPVTRCHWHFLPMAFGVLGAAPGNRITVDDPGAADVSFPGFWALLERLAGGREP